MLQFGHFCACTVLYIKSTQGWRLGAPKQYKYNFGASGIGVMLLQKQLLNCMIGAEVMALLGGGWQSVGFSKGMELPHIGYFTNGANPSGFSKTSLKYILF